MFKRFILTVLVINIFTLLGCNNLEIKSSSQLLSEIKHPKTFCSNNWKRFQSSNPSGTKLIVSIGSDYLTGLADLIDDTDLDPELKRIARGGDVEVVFTESTKDRVVLVSNLKGFTFLAKHSVDKNSNTTVISKEDFLANCDYLSKPLKNYDLSKVKKVFGSQKVGNQTYSTLTISGSSSDLLGKDSQINLSKLGIDMLFETVIALNQWMPLKAVTKMKSRGKTTINSSFIMKDRFNISKKEIEAFKTKYINDKVSKK